MVFILILNLRQRPEPYAERRHCHCDCQPSRFHGKLPSAMHILTDGVRPPAWYDPDSSCGCLCQQHRVEKRQNGDEREPRLGFPYRVKQFRHAHLFVTCSSPRRQESTTTSKVEWSSRAQPGLPPHTLAQGDAIPRACYVNASLCFCKVLYPKKKLQLAT